MKMVQPIRAPRDLTLREKRVLRSLMARKFYDCNRPKEGRRYPILLRTFIPADYQGHPIVLLLCQITPTDKRGCFEFCVYSDGLYGRGHHASDKFGSGTMAMARRSFEEHVAFELIGVWPWVINRVMQDAKRVAQ